MIVVERKTSEKINVEMLIRNSDEKIKLTIDKSIVKIETLWFISHVMHI